MFQRRIADNATIPEMAAIDGGPGKDGWQAAASQNMVDTEFVDMAIEIYLLASVNLYCRNDQTNRAVGQGGKVNVFREQITQRAKLVKAGPLRWPPFIFNTRRQPAWTKEVGNAPHDRVANGQTAIHQVGRELMGAYANIAPESFDRVCVVVRVTGDEGTIDGTNGDTAHNSRLDAVLTHGFDHAALKGTQRRTALQDKNGFSCEVSNGVIGIGQSVARIGNRCLIPD